MNVALSEVWAKGGEGVLVLADSRLATKRYGKTFIKSLPSKNVQMLDSANVRRYIEFWRQSQG